MVLLTATLIYRAGQHESSGRVSARHMPIMRLEHAELLMIFVVAIIAFALLLADRQRFNALKARVNKTFNKTFFVVLTVLLAIFTLAELWLIGSSH